MDIHIRMMRDFIIFVNNEQSEHLAAKSPKGAALMQMLILRQGETVSSSTLIDKLWNNENTSNPESALKTLVSRLRGMLSQIAPELGQCLMTDRGGYRWQGASGIFVDVLDIYELLGKIEGGKLPETELLRSCEALMRLYVGDLCQESEFNEWAMPEATSLHNRYMEAVRRYLAALKARGEYEKIVAACRTALEVDSFDDTLHIELMNALMEMNRPNDAMQQYKHVLHMYYHYLGIQPSQAIQGFYKKLLSVGRTLDFNLASIQQELMEASEHGGAFVCEYPVFKDVFNLQIRNMERLGTTMFLSLISITFMDDAQEEEVVGHDVTYHTAVMDDLIKILRVNLRRGDMVTRFSPSIVALLLPTVDYATSRMIMERIKTVFYKKYPNSGIMFDYRVTPLKTRRRSDTHLARKTAARQEKK